MHFCINFSDRSLQTLSIATAFLPTFLLPKYRGKKTNDQESRPDYNHVVCRKKTQERSRKRAHAEAHAYHRENQERSSTREVVNLKI